MRQRRLGMVILLSGPRDFMKRGHLLAGLAEPALLSRDSAEPMLTHVPCSSGHPAVRDFLFSCQPRPLSLAVTRRSPRGWSECTLQVPLDCQHALFPFFSAWLAQAAHELIVVALISYGGRKGPGSFWVYKNTECKQVSDCSLKSSEFPGDH